MFFYSARTLFKTRTGLVCSAYLQRSHIAICSNQAFSTDAAPKFEKPHWILRNDSGEIRYTGKPISVFFDYIAGHSLIKKEHQRHLKEYTSLLKEYKNLAKEVKRLINEYKNTEKESEKLKEEKERFLKEVEKFRKKNKGLQKEIKWIEKESERLAKTMNEVSSHEDQGVSASKENAPIPPPGFYKAPT